MAADGEMEVNKTEIAMGNCIKSDLERVGEEQKKMGEKELKTADRERNKKKMMV